MPDQRNPSIPFSTFYHPPIELPEVMEQKGCGNHRNLAVMNALFSLVDFNQTERINDKDYFIGVTCVISHEGLGKRSFLSARRASDAINDLCESGIIEKEKVGKCYRYRISLYQDNINRLKANPDRPHSTFSAPTGNPEKLRSIHDKVSVTEVKADTMSIPTRTQPTTKEDESSYSQESLQEDLQDSPSFSESTGSRETGRKEGNNEVEKQGNEKGTAKGSRTAEQSNQERRQSQGPTGSQRQRPSPSSASQSPDTGRDNQGYQEKSEGLDITPNSQIGKVVDNLTKEKSMNTAPKGHDTEAFLIAFRPAQGSVIATETEHRYVQELKRYIDDVAPKVEPLPLFKRCVAEANRRLELDILTEAPKQITFYYKTDWGREIVQHCADEQRYENRVQNNIEKTDSYLDDLKKRRANPAPIPTDTQAELDKLLGRS